jgi:hypothetical protein
MGCQASKSEQFGKDKQSEFERNQKGKKSKESKCTFMR